MAEKPGGGKPGGGKPGGGKPGGGTKASYGDPEQIIKIAEGLTALKKMTLALSHETHALGNEAAVSYDLAAKAAKYFGIHLDKLSESFEEQKEKLEDLSDTIEEQVSIWKKIEKSAGNASGRFDKITSSISKIGEQSENITKLSESFKSVDVSAKTASDGVKGLSNSIKQQEKALAAANKEAGFKKGGDGKNNVLEQVAKSSKSAKVGVTALGGAFNLLGKAIKGITSIFGGVFDLLSSAFGAVKSMIGGIIDFASDIFGTMIEMSNEVKERMLEQAQALEKVKEVFGDTSRGAAADVKSFVSASMNLYSPGSLSQIFGSYTEAADFARGLVESSAEMSTLLSSQLKESSVSIVKFAKGLGMAGDDFKAVMDMSYATGESIIDLQKDIGKFSQGLATRLGLNAKVLSKNILIATKDVKHFGTASVKAMAESAAYANKMGVSLDKIVGVLDQFDTFEDAANNVSKLSQAFGVNLDTMKLVEAETPEERMEMLKDSFNAAGKSLDSLSRRELSYAASLIGTDEATVKNMLSNKNQANSLNNIKDASSAVEKQTRSTADVLQESMKGVAMQLQNIQNSSKGFFDRFLDGIFEGILMSGPMQKVLGNLAQALDKVFMAGKQLGAAFVTTFPGVKKMIDALASFFDPAKIGGLFNGFTAVFETFFKKLQNGTGDVKNLFRDLFKEIKKFFLKESPAGKEFLDGISEFWNAARQIIATGIAALGEMLSDAFTSIADFLEKPPGGEGKGISGTGKKIVKSIETSPITQAAQKAFEKISEPLGRIFNSIWDKMLTSAGEKISAFFNEYKWEIALAGFGVALLSVGNLALSNPELTKGLIKGISSASSSIGSALSSAFSAAGPALAETFTKMAPNIAAGFRTASAAASSAMGSVGAAASAAAGPLIAFTAAFAAMYVAYEQYKKLKDELGEFSSPGALVADFANKSAKEAENAAKTLGEEGLRTRLGVTKQGVFEAETYSKDELISMYEQQTGKSVFVWTDDKKAELKNVIEKRYKDNLKFVKEGDEKRKADEKQMIQTAKDKRDLDEGQKMMDAIGITTIDNVEERIKKMEEIGAKLSGGKEAFKKKMEQVKKDLSEYTFNLFDSGQQENFTKMIGQGKLIITFVETTKTLFAAMQSFGNVAAGIGSESDESSIVGSFLSGLRKLRNGFLDVQAALIGGTTSTGIQTKGFIKGMQERNLAGSVENANLELSKVGKPLQKFSKRATKIFEAIENINHDVSSDSLAALGILMGSKATNEGGQPGLIDLLGTPVDMTTTADLVKKWSFTTESMFDALGKSLEKMDKSLDVVDSLKEKIQSISELKSKLDEAMKQINETRDISVAASGPNKDGVMAAKATPAKMSTPTGLNMTLNFEIKMDASSVEKGIILNPNSLIVKAFEQVVTKTGQSVQKYATSMDVVNNTAANGASG